MRIQRIKPDRCVFPWLRTIDEDGVNCLLVAVQILDWEIDFVLGLLAGRKCWRAKEDSCPVLEVNSHGKQ